MKSLLIPTLLIAASGVSLGQSHHGHGYYHSSYASSYHTTPSYTQPARPAPPVRPSQPSASEQRAAARQRAAEQRAIAAEAARQRAGQRAEETRQATLSALDAIAREAARTATPATAAATTASGNGGRQGYDCLANQTGGMNCFRQPDMNAPTSYAGQQVIRVPESYSGSLSGGGYNNPAMQAIRNNGPIPPGTWNVTGVQQTLTNSQGVTTPHANVLRLEPAAGTRTFNRDAMRVHGDNASRPGTASNGCIIVPPDVRQSLAGMVNQGGQVRIEVRR